MLRPALRPSLFASRRAALLLIALLPLAHIGFGQKQKTGTSVLVGADPIRLPKNALKRLDQTLEQLRRTWGAPGLAVAVVTNDRVVYAKGFGERDVVHHLPVTPNTLFSIASCSKSFGAATVCLLAREGYLDLDQPIHDYWPGFRLLDDYATLHVTARDLLSHRCGLPRHDLVWYHNPGVPRADLVRRLRFLPPIDEPRTAFHYQNLAYTALSQLVQEVNPAHLTWEAYTRARLLTPLGMTRTNFSVHDSERDPDHALPYRFRPNGAAEELQELPMEDVDAVGAAANVNSSAAEMGRWLRCTLTDGEVDDKEVVPADALHETHLPQMPYDLRTPDDDVYTDTYGMGWVVGSYRGFRLLTHSGSLDGFTSEMAALPAEGIAVVALTNLDDTNLAHLVCNSVLDRLTGLPRVDWSAQYQQFEDDEASYAAAEDSIPDPFRVLGTRPAHPLPAYAGRFHHPGYGDLLLTADAGGRPQLRGDLHGLPFLLAHFQYETFATSADLLPDVGPEPAAPPADPTRPGPPTTPPAGNDGATPGALRFEFSTDARGDVSQVAARLEPEAVPIVFTRVVEALRLSRAELQRFVGTYGPSAQLSYRVYLPADSDSLRVAWPGQPEYTLRPVRTIGEFVVPQLPGYTLKFTLPAGGPPEAPATDIITVQPDGLFRDRRRPGGEK